MSETFWWDAKIDGAIFIIAAHLSVSEKYSGWREGGLAGGGGVVVQLPINPSHT